MPLWTFGTVESEPQVRLTDWRVLEATYADSAESRTRHFVGCDAHGGGRVSSAITSIDIMRRCGVTKSGRVYELAGRSGGSANADYVWRMYCAINGIQSWTDESTEMLSVEEHFAALVRSVPTELQHQFELISEILARLSRGSQLVFWTSGKGSLAGATPMEALIAGQYEAVHKTATGHAHQ